MGMLEHNNIEIIIKINILLTDLSKVIAAARRRRKAVPAHMTNFIVIFNIFDSIQALKRPKTP